MIDLKLTFSGKKDEFNYKIMKLSLRNNGKIVDEISCISGTRTAQTRDFVHPANDFAGSGNPIPEGIYKIEKLIKQEFDEKGIGYEKVPLYILENFRCNNRSGFLFHDDVNRVLARGSLGCVVFYNDNDFNRVKKWLAAQAKPTQLIVDWNTGFLAEKSFIDNVKTNFKARILLERGHGLNIDGSFDPGAINYQNRITEYELNGFVCEKARATLAALGYDVVVLDQAQTLYNLGLKAQGFDAFISVHHNAHSSDAQGAEVFIHNEKGEKEDEILATFVLNKIVSSLKISNRGVKKGRLGILNGAEDTNVKASILTEGFFISDTKLNRDDIFKMSLNYGESLAYGVHEWAKATLKSSHV